jgi:enamine deaminase RidA (YjgF/YER057c/UK114 family)
MFSNLFTRRAFAGRFATLVSGVGLAAAAPSSEAAAQNKKEEMGGVKKMDWDGKPAGTGFITPLITFGGVIYISGQGAHSHDTGETFPKDIDNHTKHVMENVKHLVEVGGGTMDSVLQRISRMAARRGRPLQSRICLEIHWLKSTAPPQSLRSKQRNGALLWHST